MEGQPPAKAQSMLLKRIEGLEQVMMAKGQDEMDQLYKNTPIMDKLAAHNGTRVKGRVYWPRCREQKHQTSMSRTRWEPNLFAF